MTNVREIIKGLVNYIVWHTNNSNQDKAFAVHDSVRLSFEVMEKEDEYIEIMIQVFEDCKFADDAREYARAHKLEKFTNNDYFDWSTDFYGKRSYLEKFAVLEYVIGCFGDDYSNKLLDKFIEIVNKKL